MALNGNISLLQYIFTDHTIVQSILEHAAGMRYKNNYWEPFENFHKLSSINKNLRDFKNLCYKGHFKI